MVRHKSRDIPHQQPDLPITPMLDMSFTLLAFFVMTFNPTPAEGHLDMALPKQAGGPSEKPPDFDESDKEEITVQVTAAANGAIAGIDVLTQGATAGTPLGADSAKLFGFLRDRTASGKIKPGKLQLEMDEKLNYQFVVKLLDECTRAGYRQVSPAVLGGAK